MTECQSSDRPTVSDSEKSVKQTTPYLQEEGQGLQRTGKLTFLAAVVVESLMAQGAPSLLPLCAKEAMICGGKWGGGVIGSHEITN